MGSAAARPKATIRTPKNDPAKKAIASQIIVTASSGSIRSCSRCLGHLAVVATSFNWFAASPADSVIHRTLAVTVSTRKAHIHGAIGPRLPQSLRPSTRPARRHGWTHLQPSDRTAPATTHRERQLACTLVGGDHLGERQDCPSVALGTAGGGRVAALVKAARVPRSIIGRVVYCDCVEPLDYRNKKTGSKVPDTNSCALAFFTDSTYVWLIASDLDSDCLGFAECKIVE